MALPEVSPPESLRSETASIRFACGYCRVNLEVPEVVAGVTGPCPGCGESLTAPTLELVRGLDPTMRATGAQPPPLPKPFTFQPSADPIPLILPAVPQNHQRGPKLSLPAPRPVRRKSATTWAVASLLGIAVLGITGKLFVYDKSPWLQAKLHGIFGGNDARPDVTRVTNEGWNFTFDIPDKSWTQLHPGADNRVLRLINTADETCKTVLEVQVMGAAPKGSTAPGTDATGWLIDITKTLSVSGSENNEAREMRKIAGKNFRYQRKETEESPDLFRPSKITQCSYLCVENNVAFSFNFTGAGSKSFERLPQIAETMLAQFQPLVEGVEVSAIGNLTVVSPESMAAETGLSFPSPGGEWGPLPDAPPLLSKYNFQDGRVRFHMGDSRNREFLRPQAGEFGAPSVGYMTGDGDIAGFSVVNLPSEIAVDSAHLADLVLGAWFPRSSLDRQEEKAFQAGAFQGKEYSGQISRDLTPVPFVLRLVRHGDTLIALGACGISEKRSTAQLVKILDGATWAEPSWNTRTLGARYTPPACEAVWQHLILSIGKEKQEANQLAEAMQIYEQAYQTKALGHILMALCETHEKLSQVDKGIALLEKEWRKVDAKPDFLGQAATFLARHQKLATATDMIILALKNSRFDSHSLSEEAFEKYLQVLSEVRARDESLRVLDLVSRYMPSNHWKLWESFILYSGSETKARGVEIMEGLIASVRKNRELAQEMIAFLKQHEAHQLGLDAAMGVLRLDPQQGMAWLLRAVCERGLGDPNKATQTLAKAREYNPSLSSLEDIALALTDEAGGVMVNDQGPQVTPIPLPVEIQKLLKSESAATPSKKESPFQYLYRVFSMTNDPGNPGKTTDRVAIRIENGAGMEAYNILKLRFSPKGERIQLNELRVRTPEGKVISPSNMREAFVTEESSGGMATGMKILNMPVPGLTPGCVLEYTVTEESLGVISGAARSAYLFAENAPCALNVLYIHSPAAKVDFRHSRSQKPMKISTGLVWLERNCPELVREPNQPSWETFVPVLWTGNGNESWAGVGADYMSLIQHKLKQDDGIKKLALEKTRNCKTREEKIAILSALVRETLSYAAIEFGMRGLIPNSAAESIKNRYGDCKDHSVLLYQLLRAVDIPAKLVLANARTAVQPDLPSMGAFNHMITAIPAKQKGQWDYIDCTNKSMAPSEGVPPYALSGKYVLVLGESGSELSPESSKLVKIGGWPDGLENVTLERTVQVLEGNHLSVKEVITVTGVTACELRFELSESGARRDISTALRSYLGIDRNRYPIKLAQVENVSAVDKPLVINLEYEARNVCSRQGNTLVAHLPVFSLTRFLDPEMLYENRQTPFQFEAALNLKCHTRLFGPSGFTVAGEEPMPVDNRFGSWNAVRQNKEGYAEISLSFTRKPGVFPAKDYNEFRELIGEATQAVEEVHLLHSPSTATPITSQIGR